MGAVGPVSQWDEGEDEKEEGNEEVSDIRLLSSQSSQA